MNFTIKELDAILLLVEFKIQKLYEAVSLWLEYDDPIPEFLDQDITIYESLRDKILEYKHSLDETRKE